MLYRIFAVKLYSEQLWCKIEYDNKAGLYTFRHTINASTLNAYLHENCECSYVEHDDYPALILELHTTHTNIKECFIINLNTFELLRCINEKFSERKSVTRTIRHIFQHDDTIQKFQINRRKNVLKLLLCKIFIEDVALLIMDKLEYNYDQNLSVSDFNNGIGKGSWNYNICKLICVHQLETSAITSEKYLRRPEFYHRTLKKILHKVTTTDSIFSYHG